VKKLHGMKGAVVEYWRDRAYGIICDENGGERFFIIMV
jgi:hypothetical protein